MTFASDTSFCPKCGMRLETQSLYCTACGFPLRALAKTETSPSQIANQGLPVGPLPMREAVPVSPSGRFTPPGAERLGWVFYRLWIYFALLALILLCAAVSGALFGGVIYAVDGTTVETARKTVWETFPALRSLDFAFAIAAAAMAAYGIVVRYRLARLKRKSPSSLNLFLAGCLLLHLAYIASFVLITAAFNINYPVLVFLPVAFCLAACVANGRYFGKRKFAFVE